MSTIYPSSRPGPAAAWRRAIVSLFTCSLLTGVPAVAADPPPGPPLELIGAISWPSDYRFEESIVGGLSAISCPADAAICYAISDDRADRGPVQIYKLTVDLSDGRLDPGDALFTGLLDLHDRPGTDFAPGSVDPEGLVVTAEGSVWVSSEGVASDLIDPFLRRFDLDGEPQEELILPVDYRPTADGQSGVRENLGFESLTLTPDGQILLAATENALAQDGPETHSGHGSPARIIAYSTADGSRLGEYLYWVDAIGYSARPAGEFATQGLNELLALDETTLITLERAFVRGVGNRIRLYEATLSGAQELASALVNGRIADPGAVSSATKRLLLDLDQLGLQLDNIEGMSFGPRLPDGRRSLLLISDNNFSERQVTQLLALAVRDDALRPRRPIPGLTIAEIQGPGHRSPWAWYRVESVRGIVTTLRDRGSNPGFWIQDPTGDGDPATSEGLFVASDGQATEVQVGDRVEVDGRIEERGRVGELTVTHLAATRTGVLDRGHPEPATVLIGAVGRPIPENATDAADLFESLEGMRLEIAQPIVVGSTSRHGEFVVVADAAAAIEERTVAGALRMTPGLDLAQRLVVTAPPEEPVVAAVGARLAAPLFGILDYAWGTYRLQATPLLPAIEGGVSGADETLLKADEGHLTVATYNIENFAQTAAAQRVERLAGQIVKALAAPDILALQEVQDDSGAADDGVISAAGTLGRLCDAIAAIGGPRYDFRQIDPEDGMDGGQPGGNIRVAYLFNPQRVRFVDRGAADAHSATTVELAESGGEDDESRVQLSFSPGRIDPEHPAFNRSRRLRRSGSRKPLAAEFEAGGRRLFVINNHFNSKGGDDRLFGTHQPPLALSEGQRRDQATVVHRFVETILDLEPEAWIVVLGDLNEYDFGRPLDLLAGHQLVNLVGLLPPEDRYSYVYRGRAGAIDHILVSHAMESETAPEIDIVHLNADLPAAARVSDHDPIVARFRLPLD